MVRGRSVAAVQSPGKRIVGLDVSGGTFGDDYRMHVYQGILHYAREHTSWQLVFNEMIYSMPHKFVKYRDLPRYGAEGLLVIGGSQIKKMGGIEAILQTGLAAVNISNAMHDSRLPCVQTNDRMVGALAAEHLLKRGYRSFGICTIAPNAHEDWAEQRGSSFKKSIAGRGLPCSELHYALPAGTDVNWEQASARRLRDWIRDIPKPAGIFAVHDTRGMHVLEACAVLDLKVPNEVGVLGVDNHTFLCNSRTPSLTSVDPNNERVGYTAAELLDSLMSGAPKPDAPILIDPKEVVTRMSTDILSVEDEVVAKALIFIRDHLGDSFSVEDIVDVCGVSHSSLERRFRAKIGHTMSREIRWQRIEKVKKLLRETVMSLSEIAETTGFRRVTYLTNVFTNVTGMPPNTWRRQNRLMP